MAVGAKHQRVTIQQNTPTTNTQLGRTASWSDLATVWAEEIPLGARESLELREFIGSLGIYKFKIAYRTDVTPKMRLSWTPYRATTAKTLEIEGVQPTPDRFELVLTCGEVL